MDEPFVNQDLSLYHRDEPLIKETADQVIKDFGLFEMEITFHGRQGTPYMELYEQVLPLITRMLAENNSRLYSLMYQIDIPESWWKIIRHENEEAALSSSITDAILQRELLKVVTRNYYRKGRLQGPGDKL